MLGQHMNLLVFIFIQLLFGFYLLAFFSIIRQHYSKSQLLDLVLYFLFVVFGFLVPLSLIHEISTSILLTDNTKVLRAIGIGLFFLPTLCSIAVNFKKFEGTLNNKISYAELKPKEMIFFFINLSNEKVAYILSLFVFIACFLLGLTTGLYLTFDYLKSTPILLLIPLVIFLFLFFEIAFMISKKILINIGKLDSKIINKHSSFVSYLGQNSAEKN